MAQTGIMSKTIGNVVVTGASSGIGAATASRFADGGARVINLSRRPCPDSRVASIPLDLAAADGVAKAVQIAKDNLDKAKPLILVHNAARLVNDTVQTADPETFRALLELNVTVPMALTQGLVPWLGPGSGVIFVGSTLAEKAVPGAMSYVTSKHALIGLMRACTQDFAGTGVHTAAVCPGFTDTEMVRAHVPDEAALLAIGGNNGFGRLVTPDEIAATIEFAALNPVMNGAVIHANLGQSES